VALLPAADARLGVAAASTLGTAAGVALFTALARATPRVPRRRARVAGARGVIAVVRAVFEEAVWRLLLLGTLGPRLGTAAALAAVTASFALAHVRRQGIRGVAVHSLTGTVFGALFVAAGGVAAPAAAHATYNVLIVLALEARRARAAPARAPT
jgi:membrane protease YdiL (CAAX protease family)